MRVHGCICGSDLVWNKDKELLKTFYQASQTKNEKECIDLLNNQEQFKSLTHFDDAVPGQAFAAVRAGSVDGWCSEDALMYQVISTALKSYLDYNNISAYKADIAKTEKSYLYEMFNRNKPEWAGAVIFVDDSDTNIDSVRGMHNQLAPEHKLLTLLNLNEKKEKMNTKNFYQAVIKPFVEITCALFNAFNNYKFGRKLTYSSAKNEVLERLELALENCKTSDEVNKVKRDFDKEYQQLNHPRFSFWSDAKTRSATVFDNMIEKREEQLKYTGRAP